ncbi:uncharacterized protein N7498_000362 [Penicillium cinerascens]|uniref:Uncharacterized protein n=1 Tax=Penicillium cinerascens TaxID=70096 RepID=A0A9W9NEA1_9EURO|nr:uncharacterized protein N7498_000362 [Penicillium cinerascens]KAJ5218263.1 hypothetical protein N7498_000362 [Penicillium cinerascens]
MADFKRGSRVHVVGEVEIVEKAESRSSERGKDALGSENGKNRHDATTFCTSVDHHSMTSTVDSKAGQVVGVFEGGA